jgi:predicted PurR-regulated permease PerM
MAQRPRDWQALLVRLEVVLVALLVVIAAFAILYVIFAVIGKFYQTIFLFIVGAIVAYLLIPVVNMLQRILRKRWAAVLGVYLGVFLAIVLLGILLINPFVQQAQSLAKTLQHPSQASLNSVKVVQTDASRVVSAINAQVSSITTGIPPPRTEIERTRSEISTLQRAVSEIQSTPGKLSAAKPLGPSIPPPAQTKVPSSYIAPIRAAASQLSTDYDAATLPGKVLSGRLKTSLSDARRVQTVASQTYQTMSSNPLLLLDLQNWLDDHGFKIDINQRFGKAADQLNSQAASLVNNAANIVLTAGTLLVNTILMLIISVYFLSDGPRLVRKATQIGPAAYQARAPFYVASLDKVMGSYIRGQIIIAAIAAILGAVGAWLLGVPYAVLIGISTFFLILIPVIGAVILVIPPVLIALIFTPLPTPIYLLIYYLVMMQIVTNVLGPRVIGSAVGIHPLEAMAAALMGFPLAGLLGSFFAVPIVGFFHVAIRQAYRDFGKREMAELEATFRGEAPKDSGVAASAVPAAADPMPPPASTPDRTGAS